MNAKKQYTVQGVSQMSKRRLKDLITADAALRGRAWILGGPACWSKDEMVSYLVRETDLVRR